MRSVRRSLHAVSVWAALAAAPAHATHAPDRFRTPAAVEGFDRTYFTGSPRWRGWDCSICHQGEELVSLEATSQPPDLFESGTYEPDATYVVTLLLQGEHLGLGIEEDWEIEQNINGFAADVVDDAGRGLAVFAGADPVRFRLYEQGTVLASYPVRDELDDAPDEWTFPLVAPPRGAGPMTLYVGAVDGGGARATSPDEPGPPVDVANDDPASLAVRLCERDAQCNPAVPPASPPTSPAASCRAAPGARPSFSGAAVALIALLAPQLARRRRKPRPPRGSGPR